MTKLKFKKHKNIKIKDAAQKCLSSLKDKHTKSEGLNITGQIQSYLLSSKPVQPKSGMLEL
jgi:hypothetical protein